MSDSADLRGLGREQLEETAERALLYLHQGARDHAQNRAEHDYMQSFVKTEKARIKASLIGLSNAAAEDEALRHPAYLRALDAAKTASEEWYHVQFLREAALAHIDAWRTACSNERVNA